MKFFDFLELLVRTHPLFCVVILVLVSQAASAMPSPTLTGKLSSPGYKWFFGFMHIFVALPRLIIVLFPQYAWLFGSNAANREPQASDKAAGVTTIPSGPNG